MRSCKTCGIQMSDDLSIIYTMTGEVPTKGIAVTTESGEMLYYCSGDCAPDDSPPQEE